MAGKSKVISKSAGSFAKGGTKGMFGKQSVGTKTPGITGKADSGGGGAWAKGGSGTMFGKQTAGTRTPGQAGT